MADGDPVRLASCYRQAVLKARLRQLKHRKLPLGELTRELNRLYDLRRLSPQGNLSVADAKRLQHIESLFRQEHDAREVIQKDLNACLAEGLSMVGLQQARALLADPAPHSPEKFWRYYVQGWKWWTARTGMREPNWGNCSRGYPEGPLVNSMRREVAKVLGKAAVPK